MLSFAACNCRFHFISLQYPYPMNFGSLLLKINRSQLPGLVAFLFLFPGSVLNAQKSFGMDHSVYVLRNSGSLMVPSLHYETKDHLYGSLRYQYEAEGTVSMHLGKTFFIDGSENIFIRPMAGVLVGRWRGASVGMEAEVEKGVFSFFAAPQYCASFQSADPPFFYSWSEARLTIASHFFAGVACQSTRIKAQPWFHEAGLFGGVSFGRFEWPFYYFFSSASSVVTGLRWNLNK